MDGSKELNTKHYTRTYFGLTMRGDSGRWWGTGLVKAYGEQCDSEVANYYKHYVKYGTTDE